MQIEPAPKCLHHGIVAILVKICSRKIVKTSRTNDLFIIEQNSSTCFTYTRKQ